MRASAGMTFARYFREAVLIHCFALASAGVYALISARWNSDESTALRGVAISAAIVFYFWSLVSAVRSCRKGEPLQPLTVFGLIILLEGLIFFCAQLKAEPTQSPRTLADYADYYAVAFFAVFGIVMTFIAAPLAAWRIRRQNAKLEKRPHYREVYVRTLKQYGIIMAALSLLFLPVTLFYYCARSTTYLGDPYEEKSWRVSYIEFTPEFFRDCFCDVLSVLSTKSNKGLHLKMIDHRWVSNAHLEKNLTAAPIFKQSAICALVREDSAGVLPHALTVASAGPTRAHPHAAKVLAQYGSEEQIRKVLHLRTAVSLGFRNDLIEELQTHRKNEFIEEIKLLAERDVLSRNRALQALAADLSAEELLRIWPHYLSSKDSDLRIRAAWAINQFKSDPFPIVEAALRICDERATEDLVRNFSIRFVNKWHKEDEFKRWIALLGSLADNSASQVSSRARIWLTSTFNDKSLSEEKQLEELNYFINSEYDWPDLPIAAPNAPAE